MERVGTHAIAVNKEQARELVDHLISAFALPEVETLFLITSDDEQVNQWFESGFSPGQVGREPEFDSIFTGQVWVLGVGFEINDDTLEQLGMEVAN
jgi:hypothetical protein